MGKFIEELYFGFKGQFLGGAICIDPTGVSGGSERKKGNYWLSFI